MNDPIQSSLLSGSVLGPQIGLNPQSRASEDLGQADFLRLMTAQLEAQDPLKPQESGEFLSQLAQFGTVNGIQALQESFEGMNSSLQSLQALQASTLVGRSVIVESNRAQLPAQGSIVGSVDAQGVNNLVFTVTNAAGAKVHQEAINAGADGVAPFSWSGQSANGTQHLPGLYTVSVQGTVAGEPVALATRTEAAVDSVTLGSAGQGMTLNLAGLGSIDASAIVAIK